MRVAKKCWKVGCIRAGALKIVITVPMTIKATGNRIAAFCLILEDGICKECFATVNRDGCISLEDHKRLDWDLRQRGWVPEWNRVQIHGVSLDFKGVINGKFHKDDLKDDGIQIPDVVSRWLN